MNVKIDMPDSHQDVRSLGVVYRNSANETTPIEYALADANLGESTTKSIHSNAS